MDNQEIRATLDRYWEATLVHDLKKVHEFYHNDMVVEFPQSCERIRGNQNIYELRHIIPLELVSRFCGLGEKEISG